MVERWELSGSTDRPLARKKTLPYKLIPVLSRHLNVFPMASAYKRLNCTQFVGDFATKGHREEIAY